MEKGDTHSYERVDEESDTSSFLNSSHDTLLNQARRPGRRLWWKIPTFAVVHLVLAGFYLSWTFMLLHSGPQQVHVNVQPGPDLVYSPAREAVKYETVLMNGSLYEQNEFKGLPTEEQTEAWNSILMWSSVLVQQEDLDQINHDTSVKLADGSGYLIMLDVFHQIHCLDIIRRWIHRDYYEIKDSPMMAIRHVDHCIDTLRQIAMCHGDITMVTFDWVESQPFPFPNFLVNRECRNWDSILQWAKEHHADESQIIRPSDIPFRPRPTQVPTVILPGTGGGIHE